MSIKNIACLTIFLLSASFNKLKAQDSTLRWDTQKAWDWYDQQSWYCGFNYIPAYAINYTAMWDKTTFDAKAIDAELGLAEAAGMNVLRAVLQYAVYADDPAYFEKTLDIFMGICAKHKIKFVPALFDDCVFGITFEPRVGRQSEPLKGWYAWDWSPSPGHRMVIDSLEHPKLEAYVTAVMTRFKNDRRILFWDLYNEPTNGGLGTATLPLLKKVIGWARKVGPSQPVSIDVWNDNRRLNDIVLAGSDIISFHNYGNKTALQHQINDLKKYNRPLICTEWMNRPNHSTIPDNLPVFYHEKVGCMLWGLVNGKTQTDLPWGHRPGDPPQAVWQHDLYRPDFAPYDQQEIDSIKMYTIPTPKIPASANRKTPKKEDLYTPTWIADNGNGTFTNPLFYEEFSDPDIIRVGDDYYLTGTTNHAMPGLPLLHSKDLVNWDFICTVSDKLDFGPEYRLEEGKDIYGQGIWAPCLRHHNNTFYIFTNVNGQTTQLYTAKDPHGPWTHSKMKRSFHDVSVLFDDDGKTYVVWGYDEIHMAELSDDLLDIRPGSEKIIVPRGSGAGEGCHFYKINGRYYITNTNYDPLCYQVCLRASKPEGPYEVNVMSAQENMGVGTGWRMKDTRKGPPYELIPPVPNFVGSIPMHQGGIIQIQSGEWWGWSMMDYNSIGRVTALSPVTWKDDWPYFGLPGNLTRSPRSWTKPATGVSSPPHATYRRSDDFSAAALQPIWQWNHVALDTKWSLTERKGFLRLHSLPAKDLLSARNSLTQRAVGPESIVTTQLDAKGLDNGDLAGLALLNLPFAWIGIHKTNDALQLQQFDQQTGRLITKKLPVNAVWLRVQCNFDNEKAVFSYSTDGNSFVDIGDTTIMVFQLRTFQGVRYTLFNYNAGGKAGGYADFDDFIVNEPRPRGLTKPIPYNQIITFSSLADNTVLVNWKHFLRPVDRNSPLAKTEAAHFRVLDRGNGRVALQSVSDSGYVTVRGLGVMADVRIEKQENGPASLFQWEDMLQGDLMLLSLYTNKYLFADPFARSLLSADSRGTSPDRKDGSCFMWDGAPAVP